MSAPVFTSVMPSLPVSDMDDAIAFYTESLGFALCFRNESNYAIVQRDGIEAGLMSMDASGIPAGAGRCYFKLSSGIEALYFDYVRREVDILHEMRDESYGMREFMIADPDQNEINFGQAI